MALRLINCDSVDNSQNSVDNSVIHAEKLATYFCYECGFAQLPYMARQFVRWLQDGCEYAMIKQAIDTTARAPRPSFAYLDTVVRNFRAHGIHCLPVSEKPYRSAEKRVSAQMYTQREYTEEQLAAAECNLIAEALRLREEKNQKKRGDE